MKTSIRRLFARTSNLGGRAGEASDEAHRRPRLFRWGGKKARANSSPNSTEPGRDGSLPRSSPSTAAEAKSPSRFFRRRPSSGVQSPPTAERSSTGNPTRIDPPSPSDARGSVFRHFANKRSGGNNRAAERSAVDERKKFLHPLIASGAKEERDSCVLPPQHNALSPQSSVSRSSVETVQHSAVNIIGNDRQQLPVNEATVRCEKRDGGLPSNVSSPSPTPPAPVPASVPTSPGRSLTALTSSFSVSTPASILASAPAPTPAPMSAPTTTTTLTPTPDPSASASAWVPAIASPPLSTFPPSPPSPAPRATAMQHPICRMVATLVVAVWMFIHFCIRMVLSMARSGLGVTKSLKIVGGGKAEVSQRTAAAEDAKGKQRLQANHKDPPCSSPTSEALKMLGDIDATATDGSSGSSSEGSCKKPVPAAATGHCAEGEIMGDSLPMINRSEEPRVVRPIPRSTSNISFSGAEISEVDGDGRCLFRALSRCRFVAGLSALGEPNACLYRELERSERTDADNLRSQAVQELRMCRHLLAGTVIPGDFDEYTKRMSYPWVYGGEPEMFVLATVLEAPIAVYLVTDNGYRRIQLYGEQYRKEPYCLVFVNKNHYDSLFLGVHTRGELGSLIWFPRR